MFATVEELSTKEHVTIASVDYAEIYFNDLQQISNPPANLIENTIRPALMSNPNLEELTLDLILSRDWLQLIADVLQHKKSLKSLSLFIYGVDQENFNILTDALQENSSIESLHFCGPYDLLDQNHDLYRDQLETYSASIYKMIATSLIGKTNLSCLSFSNIAIDGKGLNELVPLLLDVEMRINKLDFYYNHIRLNQADKFIDALDKNKTLAVLKFNQSIELDRDYGSDQAASGFQDLCVALSKQVSLKKLVMSTDYLNVHEIGFLFDAISTNLQQLTLYEEYEGINEITSEDENTITMVNKLASALKRNKILEKIQMFNDETTEDVFSGNQELISAFEQNFTIKTLGNIKFKINPSPNLPRMNILYKWATFCAVGHPNPGNIVDMATNKTWRDFGRNGYVPEKDSSDVWKAPELQFIFSKQTKLATTSSTLAKRARYDECTYDLPSEIVKHIADFVGVTKINRFRS